MLVSLLGAYLHRQAKTGLAQVASELETAVEIEDWAASNSSQVVLKEVLDPAAPAAWRSRILWEDERFARECRRIFFGRGTATSFPRMATRS